MISEKLNEELANPDEIGVLYIVMWERAFPRLSEAEVRSLIPLCHCITANSQWPHDRLLEVLATLLSQPPPGAPSPPHPGDRPQVPGGPTKT